MDNVGAVGLTRQIALSNELDTLATNLANMSTHGYRRQGVVFAEYVKALEQTDLGSLSMADAQGKFNDLRQGVLSRTGGEFDLAIEGEGFFQVETANGPRLTRAGAFTPNAEGQLVDAAGRALLDAGGAPIQIPPGATNVSIAPDGALSVDGNLVAQVGVFTVPEQSLTREPGTLFSSTAAPVPVETPKIAQGFLESSNVTPIAEITRMIEVQRAYELGSQLMSNDDRMRLDAIDRLGRTV